MKTNKYQRRFYRDWIKPSQMHLLHIMEKETDLEILTDKPVDKDFVKERIHALRWDIEHYINKDRRFLVGLKPVEVELNAPLIVREMAKQARRANVGPMAAVAGAVAEFLARDLLKKKYKEVIIENGGDIFMKINKPRAIGIYSGRSNAWRNLALKIKPKDTPLGICTSSGTIGHSLSFGRADSVVILARSASLADAVATTCANRVNSKKDMQNALDCARAIPGVLGVVIIMGKDLLSWGKVEFLC